jgi:hypothetical protein
MPTYTFLNKETGEVFDKLMSYSSRQEYLEQNPNLEIVMGAPAMGDSVRLGIRRTDDGFREVLSRIGAANYKSNLSDKLSRK